MKTADIFQPTKQLAGMEHMDGRFLANLHDQVLREGTSDGTVRRLWFDLAFEIPLEVSVTVSEDLVNRRIVIIGPGEETTEGAIVVPLVPVAGLPPAFVVCDKRITVYKDETGDSYFCLVKDRPRLERRKEIAETILRREGIMTPDQLASIDPALAEKLQEEMRSQFETEGLGS